MSDLTFKVCIFGDAAVGKTSLVTRYLKGIFDPGYQITVGVDFHTKKIEIEDNLVTLQIWDFAGEHQFRFILPGYARGSAGGVFMYDITRHSSLESLDEWIEIFRSGKQKELWEAPVLMVGGKLDLQKEREVSTEEASELAASKDLFGFLECSSKTGENVDQIFFVIARAIMEKRGLL